MPIFRRCGAAVLDPERTPEDIRGEFSLPLDEMMADSNQSLLRILHYHLLMLNPTRSGSGA